MLRAIGVGSGGSLWAIYWAALRFAVVVALTVGLGLFALGSKREELEAARREIQVRELAEARLASLQSRVHPHFLFNTLNSIAAPIPEDPKRAEDAVQRLEGLFGEKSSLEVAPPAAGGAALQLRLPVTRQASERS